MAFPIFTLFNAFLFYFYYLNHPNSLDKSTVSIPHWAIGLPISLQSFMLFPNKVYQNNFPSLFNFLFFYQHFLCNFWPHIMGVLGIISATMECMH